MCIGPDDNITYRYLIDFLKLSDGDECDLYNPWIHVEETDTPVEVEIPFEGALPNRDAKEWHCKWKVDVEDSLISAGVEEEKEDREANGWIVLEAVANGFDKNVIVVMQPPGKFYDYNYYEESTDPSKQSFVARAQNGQKFVFPAEYDIFVDVSPYRLRSIS